MGGVKANGEKEGGKGMKCRKEREEPGKKEIVRKKQGGGGGS